MLSLKPSDELKRCSTATLSDKTSRTGVPWADALSELTVPPSSVVPVSLGEPRQLDELDGIDRP